MGSSSLIESYQVFWATARPFVQVTDEAGYARAQEALESVLELVDDTPDDPMNPLIDLLSGAIARYEAQDEELAAFVTEARAREQAQAVQEALLVQALHMRNEVFSGATMDRETFTETYIGPLDDVVLALAQREGISLD